MSVLKRRLYRNTSDGYVTVHLETDASCVIMPNGQTLDTYSFNVFVAAKTAPTDTTKLWIDTAAGGLKYYNGSAWVVMPIHTSSLDQTFVNTAKNALSQIFVAGTTAPTDTRKLWIDTSTNSGLKYHNGSAWVAVPVLYT